MRVKKTKLSQINQRLESSVVGYCELFEFWMVHYVPVCVKCWDLMTDPSSHFQFCFFPISIPSKRGVGQANPTHSQNSISSTGLVVWLCWAEFSTTRLIHHKLSQPFQHNNSTEIDKIAGGLLFILLTPEEKKNPHLGSCPERHGAACSSLPLVAF